MRWTYSVSWFSGVVGIWLVSSECGTCPVFTEVVGLTGTSWSWRLLRELVVCRGFGWFRVSLLVQLSGWWLLLLACDMKGVSVRRGS